MPFSLKISIITINFNNQVGLEKTMKSVFNQSYNNIEYIVIDGGSIDGSAELIKAYEAKINYWISENDNGIYHAMNKGINKANGDYLLFLNSGDTLNNEFSIEQFIEGINGNLTDIIYGDLVVISIIGELEHRKYPKDLSFDYFLYSSLPHPSTFIKKGLFDKYGLYDESLKICSDWKFFVLLICKYNCTHSYVPKIISQYNLDGISSDDKNLKLIRAEQSIVFNKEFSKFIKNYIELEELRYLKDNMIKNRTIKFLSKIGILRLPPMKRNTSFTLN